MNSSIDAVHLRLEALSCPFDPLPDISDLYQAQKLIVWLEDTHIRRWPIDDRSALHDVATFTSVFRAYLREMNAPSEVIPNALSTSSLSSAISWLIDIALHLHYADNASLYNEPIDPWHGLCVPIIPTTTSNENNNAIHDAVSTLLDVLSVKLKDVIPKDDDALAVASDIVHHIMTIPSDFNAIVPSIDDMPLGFNTGDHVVDRAAKIMRALHVRQLRQLQDEINDVVADMQALTADPKTNSKLGKVGR